MSFRELRRFSEIMRSLGYPRPISFESFRVPNFPLVADILYWLVQRYDPSAHIPDSIDTENDRVEFLSSVVQLMASKARLTLKAKHLYAADGRAVKELLKIAEMLYKARKLNKESLRKGQSTEEFQPVSTGAVDQVVDNSDSKTSSSEITELGAGLYDLLENETQLREARQSALRFLDAVSGNLDAKAEHKHLEQSIRDAISSTSDQVESLKQQVDDLENDHQSLQSKVSKKQAELERNEKRLASLQTVRPAFMDEYERLERELAEEYEVYMQRYRNLDYLENQLDAHNKQEQAKLEASNRALKRLQRKLRQRDIEEFRGNEAFNEEDAYSSSDSEKSEQEGERQKSQAPPQRPVSSRGRPASSRAGEGRVKGSLQYQEEESSSESDSDISDSDISGDDDDNDGEDDEDLSGSEGSFGEEGSSESEGASEEL
eukprot:gb/GECG01003209.1/.p1 GENE.gb/GECG01003209.1/~~gb/GECG01003209.1/.p1  ORF type:complete len:432 (+),score=86.44 gb/GECG01003209.1/:1-1296(+)